MLGYLCAEIRIRIQAEGFSKKAGRAANGVSAGFSQAGKFTALPVLRHLLSVHVLPEIEFGHGLGPLLVGLHQHTITISGGGCRRGVLKSGSQAGPG